MHTARAGSPRRLLYVFALLWGVLALAAWACKASPGDDATTTPPPTATTRTDTPLCSAQGNRIAPTVDYNARPAPATFTLVSNDTLALRQGGQVILRFGAGNNFTLYAPQNGSGPVHIDKWNGTKEVGVTAGGGYVEQGGADCTLTSIALGEVKLIPAGTTFVFSHDPQAQRVDVAVYEGAVRVIGLNAALEKPLQAGLGAVFENGAWSYDFTPPDLQTALDQLSRGEDLEGNSINGVPDETVTTEVPLPPEQTPLVVWTFWAADDPALPGLERRFEALHPEIDVQFQSYDPDELLKRMQTSLAAGSGPDLWMATHSHAGQFVEQKLADSLQRFPTEGVFASLDRRTWPAVTYAGIPAGIPVAFRGVVLYRNQKIAPQAQDDLEALFKQAQAIREASGGEVEGTYFEKGAYFTAGSLYGQGGLLMDENGSPAFASDAGMAWLAMLDRFGQGGPLSYYGDDDLERFAAGQVGWIIDGTWNRQRLADALGKDVLKIDPWPMYGNGRMGGFLEVETLYLNPQIDRARSEAAWALMAFLASPEAQQVLHDNGHIPVSIEIGITDPLVQQAMVAFGDNTLLPNLPALEQYWGPLDEAIQSATEPGVELRPGYSEALALAARRIRAALTP